VTYLDDLSAKEQEKVDVKEYTHLCVCVGEGPYAEKPGDIDVLELPVEQIQAVERWKGRADNAAAAAAAAAAAGTRSEDTHRDTDTDTDTKTANSTATAVASSPSSSSSSSLSIILILLEGRARILGPLPSYAHAIIHAMLPGPFGGQAIAETLTGIYMHIHMHTQRHT
jgi:hypothetical protein